MGVSVGKNTENASAETASLLLTAIVVLRKNFLLIVGGAAWWSSHYLTFWNSAVITRETYFEGTDRIWLISVAATVLVLGILTLLMRNKPSYQLSSRRWPYGVITVCLTTGLLMLTMPAGNGIALATIGAALTGFGNSFCHIIFGELHTRMGKAYVPLACALESAAGVAIYALFAPLPAALLLGAAVGFALLSAVLYFVSARRHARWQVSEPEQSVPGSVPAASADIRPLPLAVFAVLFGLSYGFVRTFTSNNLTDLLSASLPFEMLGTLLAATLLVAVFFLQKKRTLLEICFIFVIPFVATGMLLLPFNSVPSALPTLINTGGFACFFMLLWYFAAVVGKPERSRHVSFLIALFFFCIQCGQMVGALAPSGWVNIFSTELIYVLLLLSVFFFLRQRGKDMKDSVEKTVEAGSRSVERAQDGRLTQGLGLSPREAEVLELLLMRTPYKHIERELFVSANTVKTHVRNIYKKVGVSSREELLEKLSDLANNG